MKLYQPKNISDGFFAVFNHNDYEYTKARETYIKKYGLRSFEKKIKQVIKKGNGIMAIFDINPNNNTIFFVNEIAKLVDKRLGRTNKGGN